MHASKLPGFHNFKLCLRSSGIQANSVKLAETPDLTNFYHQFIFNYSDIVIPLTCLTQKDIPWKFDSFCQDAFNSLKKAFTSTPIFTHWIPNAQLIVETDASDYALVAILSIVNEDNEVYPVAFHSHTFTVVELNYNTHDKELLAIFEAFKI